MYSNVGLLNPSIVLNGKGSVKRFLGIANTTEIPPTYHVTFEPGKRYLMRLINTSFKSGFRFSIDGHRLLVVQNDLVPIEPYWADSISVHIGQRFNVVVQANDRVIGDGNFWIRTYQCYTRGVKPGNNAPNHMKTGIVRYNNQSTADPTTDGGNIPQLCDDGPLGNIKPMLNWTVGPSKNQITNGENIRLMFPGATMPKPYIHANILWDVKAAAGKKSKEFFQINNTNPMFLRLAKPDPKPSEVVIFDSDKFTDDTWVCHFTTLVHLS